MINELKQLVSKVLQEADEPTEEERQADIAAFLAAKRAGTKKGTGDIAAEIQHLATRQRLMWMIPFRRIERQNRTFKIDSAGRKTWLSFTFGEILGVDGMVFEAPEGVVWFMTKKGHARAAGTLFKKIRAFVNDKSRSMEVVKSKLPPEKLALLVPNTLISNPSLAAAIEADVAKPVTLDREDGTYVSGHDAKVAAAEKAARGDKASLTSIIDAERERQAAGPQRSSAEEAELAALMADQEAESAEDTTDVAQQWDDDVESYLYGDASAKDDEYAGAGEWQEDFESEFERRMGDR